MLGIAFKTKKELKSAVNTDISGRIIETSMFGSEYDPNLSGAAVVVSMDPTRTRNTFAQIWVKDNILIKVT